MGRKFSLINIINASSSANSLFKSIEEKYNNYIKDKNKKERLEKYWCKACFYLRNSFVGVPSMKTDCCSICDKKMSFGAIAPDVLCVSCAKKYKLCSHCGGDINQKMRRKFELESGDENT